MTDPQDAAGEKAARDPADAPSSFRNVNDLIGKIHRCMRRFFESQMKKYDITPPQFEVLMTLWNDDGLVLSEMGRRLSRDGPTITGIIDRMENKKLVRRKRSMRDRRVIQVFLTPKAWEVRENLMRMTQEASKDTTETLSEHDVSVLETLLKRVLLNLEEKILPKTT